MKTAKILRVTESQIAYINKRQAEAMEMVKDKEKSMKEEKGSEKSPMKMKTSGTMDDKSTSRAKVKSQASMETEKVKTAEKGKSDPNAVSASSAFKKVSPEKGSVLTGGKTLPDMSTKRAQVSHKSSMELDKHAQGGEKQKPVGSKNAGSKNEAKTEKNGMMKTKKKLLFDKDAKKA